MGRFYYLTVCEIYYLLFIFDGEILYSGWRGSSGAEIALNIAVIPIHSTTLGMTVERVYLILWSTTENTVQGFVVVY